MRVPVVGIREVRMGVHQPHVLVPVRMPRSGRHRRHVLMVVMRVAHAVNVRMALRQLLESLRLLSSPAQVQLPPAPPPCARHPHLPGTPFPEKHDPTLPPPSRPPSNHTDTPNKPAARSL